LKKIKEKRKQKSETWASRLQAPLCAVRAGQKKRLVFYIGEEKRKDRKKPSEKELRACKPLYAPSAQGKRKDWYSILVKKKEKIERNQAKRGFAPASPSMRRPRRTKNKSGILYW